MSRTVLLSLPLVLGLAPALAAQSSTHRLAGSESAVYNLVGQVTVRGGSGSEVTVEVNRTGRDAARLTIETTPVRGVPALRVLYPDDDIVYPALGRHSRTSFSVREDGTWGGEGGRRGRQVTVRGNGDGLEAAADLTVTVPRGRKVSVYLGVGVIEASNVDGTIHLDAASADVEATGMEGTLSIDTGSGDVTVSGANGVVDLDTGSGSVRIERSRGSRLEVETGSGDVSGGTLAFQTADIETGSGGIALTAVTAPAVELEAGSGDIELQLAASPDHLNVETGSGDIRVRISESVSAMIELSTGSGDFQVDFPLQLIRRGEDELRGRIGDGKGRITIETGSGDITITR